MLLSPAHSLRAGGIASHHRRCMDAETNHADQAKFVGCSHVWLVTPRHRAAMAGPCSAQARAALVYFPSNLIPVFALRGKAKARSGIRREDRQPESGCPTDRENRSGTAAEVLICICQLFSCAPRRVAVRRAP